MDREETKRICNPEMQAARNPGPGTTRCQQTLHPICRQKQGNSKGGAYPNYEARGANYGLFVKETRPRGGRMAPCVCIIVATTLLVKDADKLTLGQNLTVATPHAIEEILKHPLDGRMSNGRVTHYPALLFNPSKINFQVPTTLSPATLLPDPNLKAPFHDFEGILAWVYCIRSDLQEPFSQTQKRPGLQMGAAT